MGYGCSAATLSRPEKRQSRIALMARGDRGRLVCDHAWDGESLPVPGVVPVDGGETDD